MSKSTGSRASRKPLTPPKKPYPDFPLTPHACGKWVKKIRKTIHYFGQWFTRVDGVPTRVANDGWESALAEYKKVADDLHAGRTPRVRGDGGLTVKDLCNKFLTAKLRKVEARELTSRLFAEYKECAELCAAQFGAGRLVDDLAADDFAALRATFAKKWGPVRVGNSITRTKSIFKFGFDSGLMDRPVRYGPEFVKPNKAAMRRHKAKKPARMFGVEEVRALIDGKEMSGADGARMVKPDVTLRAMILLGLNCGFGNGDCSELTFDGLNLDCGWIDFPRPKTGIARRCPLWPETVAAIRAAIDVRPKPDDFPSCGRVFLTTRGNPFIVITEKIGVEGEGENKTMVAKSNRKDLIGIQFGKLLTAHGTRRAGVGFYSLRHVFETIGGEAKDQVAVDLIMGHADPSMGAVYREKVSDTRLRAVADHVRNWLWPDAPNAGVNAPK